VNPKGTLIRQREMERGMERRGTERRAMRTGGRGLGRVEMGSTSSGVVI
jgi:hypothetical protein